MNDKRSRELEESSEHERMEVRVVGRAAPLLYPPLETVVAGEDAETPEARKPPHGFGHPAKKELHRSAVVPADAGTRTMDALTDALEEIMIELGGGIHA